MPPETGSLEINQLSLYQKSPKVASVTTFQECNLTTDSAKISSEKTTFESSKRLLSPHYQIIRLELDHSEDVTPAWLDVHACLECTASSYFDMGTSLARITQQSVTKNKSLKEGVHRIDLSRLSPGEELVLSNPVQYEQDSSANIKMSIILTYQQMDPIILECSWNNFQSHVRN